MSDLISKQDALDLFKEWFDSEFDNETLGSMVRTNLIAQAKGFRLSCITSFEVALNKPEEWMPDWDTISLKYLAMDSDGDWYSYSTEPYTDNDGNWTIRRDEWAMPEDHIHYRHPNWKESLLVCPE